MSVAIRIDNELYEEAKRSAEAECRTVPLQVIYWAKIGKAASITRTFLLNLFAIHCQPGSKVSLSLSRSAQNENCSDAILQAQLQKASYQSN